MPLRATSSMTAARASSRDGSPPARCWPVRSRIFGIAHVMVRGRYGEGCEPPDLVLVAQGGTVGAKIGKAPPGTATTDVQRLGRDQVQPEPFRQRLQPRGPPRTAARRRRTTDRVGVTGSQPRRPSTLPITSSDGDP